MELTRKQKILLGAGVGVAVLAAAGIMLWIALGTPAEPIPAEPVLPSAAPALPGDTPAASPTLTPSPSPTPPSTPYRLPLVPEGEAASPKEGPPTETGPTETAIGIRSDARTGVFTAEQKEFLAIGTQNGEAVAVLLVRVQPPAATVLAIPCETLAPVYTLGADCTVLGVETAPLGTATARAESEKAGCWNLIWSVKNLTGFQAPAYLCVDFRCMESFFAYAPSLPGETGAVTLAAFRDALQESGETRARSMGELGVGAARYLLKVSLWELPGFRNATRDAFSASLSVLELFSLLHALRGVRTFSLSVLPVEQRDGAVTYTGEGIPF